MKKEAYLKAFEECTEQVDSPIYWELRALAQECDDLQYNIGRAIGANIKALEMNVECIERGQPSHICSSDEFHELMGQYRAKKELFWRFMIYFGSDTKKKMTTAWVRLQKA